MGVRDFVIDSPERKIPVTVWYPAQNPEAVEEAVTYTMDFLADPAAGFPTGGRTARRNAGPLGRRLSSGALLTRRLVLPSDSRLLRRAPGLARLRGYGGCTRGQLGDLRRVHLQERDQPSPRHGRQLDFAEELTAPKGEMAGLIDMEHVAVTGQSFGGTIALEMGGARRTWQNGRKPSALNFQKTRIVKVSCPF